MICAHFGWTWEYLHTGIAFNTIQKVMQDLPEYESADEDDNYENLEEQDAKAFAEKMNNFSY